MANVTGPTTHLPGDSQSPPSMQMCDEHPAVLAYRRVTGETDSMGSEEHDLCKTCWTAWLVESKKKIIATCDWCKAPEVEVQPTRDYDEGNHGPVYDVCSNCRKRQQMLLEEEAQRHDDNDEW